MQTIVIGHKNPDMDSICAAISYAELKRLNGQSGVIAARAGNTNERIDFVLGKFGVEAPVLINDLSPRVSDVMEPKVISVRADSPVYDALQLIDQKRLRGLPVVDEKNRCLGLLSAFMVSHHLFPPREEAGSTRIVTASLADIVTTFGGALVTGSLSATPEEQFLMVGAMAQDSFFPRLQKYSDRNVVLFVGDRPHIQEMAIKAQVHAIVVTGGLRVDEEIRAKARAADVTIISSPHDTATSVLLARGAVRVERMVESDYRSFQPDTLLEDARQLAAQSAAFIFPVIDDQGALVGILSKSDFLKDIPRQLILVDHNELTQAVRGADKVPIIEILDHHKLGGFSSDTPILFWNNPVGSTSSIVTMCYQQLGVGVPAHIAGLLMAGIVSDTLNLTSPTTTPADCDLLNRLSKIAGVDPDDLAEQIFSVGSPLLTMSAEQAITADCKPYEEDDHRFSVAQIEELSFAHFHEKSAALLAALDTFRKRDGLLFAALLVTDINDQSSLLLVQGADAFLQKIDYPQRSQHIWELAGVVSRKKQLLPYLLHCLALMNASKG
ncbi:MAG: putative manganese-dependent inorganic diphosphatase [Chthoniobacter sp.]|uniref:putative manganese-dependent inorganic diphosphatase n=1 Tax=Chthoniobacter sp. TaxID=2510640 RepID=UPI0032A8AD40